MDSHNFLFSNRLQVNDGLPAVSLFSGAGLSDLGYEASGFRFVVHSEIESNRGKLCEKNFPDSTLITGDLWDVWESVAIAYENREKEKPTLITITPPCQGLSSSNSGRGKVSDPKTNDKRNLLLLASMPLLERLKPKIFILENVPQVFSRVVQLQDGNGPVKLVKAFTSAIKDDYVIFSTTVQLANYGIPQDRRRAILVGIHRDEVYHEWLTNNNLIPIPKITHFENPRGGLSKWITLEDWF